MVETSAFVQADEVQIKGLAEDVLQPEVTEYFSWTSALMVNRF